MSSVLLFLPLPSRLDLVVVHVSLVPDDGQLGNLIRLLLDLCLLVVLIVPGLGTERGSSVAVPLLLVTSWLLVTILPLQEVSGR